ARGPTALGAGGLSDLIEVRQSAARECLRNSSWFEACVLGLARVSRPVRILDSGWVLGSLGRCG
ncbi:MAG TPA: hypothetical protein P5055_04660, partial [Candidatus Paceibacterota bacterium]|nr:hypothetical protein [Candidatus Paceibacterota bacterium]